MAKIDLQYDLVNYTPASASPVEANFNRIEQHINQELVERDGTVAMTAQLKLVGDPVAALDAAPKQYVDQVLPVGIIMMFGGTATPPGGRWAMCNGAEMESVAFPDLFAVIGRNFSPAGTPAGRFNLPNLVDRFAVGAGTIAAIGAAGGNKDAVLVAHAHAGGNHAHGMEQHYHWMGNHVHGEPARDTGDVNALHRHITDIDMYYWEDGTPWAYAVVHGAAGAGQGTIPMNRGKIGVTYDGHHFHTTGAGTTGGPNNNNTDANSAHNTLSAYSGDTDTRGVAATNANLPPYVGVTYIMRVS